MKTKLLALLFLVGSAAFAAPRVAIGVGVGGVGVGVGVGPAYGYYAAPPAPYVAPAPVYWGASCLLRPTLGSATLLRTSLLRPWILRSRLEAVTTWVCGLRRHLVAMLGCLPA
jgi:hypothetical protein